MKQQQQLAPSQHEGRRSDIFRNSPDSGESVKSPAMIFWFLFHALCCLISILLGFRFSRLLFFTVLPTSTSPSTTTTTTTIYAALPSPPKINFSSGGVVVGRHGILIRPWPHPDPSEVMEAHTIIERVQSEQRSQYGVKNPRTVIAITPTHVRTFQALHLTGLMHSLMNVPYDLIWIVVEAGGATNETASLISKSGLRIVHIGFDGEMPVSWEDRHGFEAKMRLHALRVVVQEKRLDGIVMFADDSNMHNLELFDEIQKVKWIGAVSVGILAHLGGSEEGGSRDDSEKAGKNSQVPVQGPACNSSDHLVGLHTFDAVPFIGDGEVVLPKKLEWAGFVLNSRLVWKDMDKPGWVKELDEVGGDVESPISLLKDGSVVEPLGSCGRKVMLWWLRVEARADGKYPARWIIGSPLDITVPAKRTPWPDALPEISSLVEKEWPPGIQDAKQIRGRDGAHCAEQAHARPGNVWLPRPIPVDLARAGAEHDAGSSAQGADGAEQPTDQTRPSRSTGRAE
ncbi:probable beta-1 4-xylosyltransferase irx14h [Phtheirospermum japonicum]|uniref:Glycosyltransferases n=1 Tax=Phtheirospermum japonicum TaxID=374723 RepID=A0A830BA96_9LAMI|nr:probable beta-1 4-xylosyltransferase irx14h [Phtheirospermum japonicum]